MNSRSSETRRARPWLGTIVEIRAAGRGRATSRAMDTAFRAVAQIHQQMSFHDPGSELSRLNCSAHERAVKVSPDLWLVLREALRLSRLSDGAFDPTVGARLVRWGLVPAPQKTIPKAGHANWRHIRLLPGRRVRFDRPLWVDLGGIAKGHAVDLAIDTLRRHGIRAGLVNAGGDLRVFGAVTERVHVRHPDQPFLTIPLADLSDAAIATSGGYFSEHRRGGRLVNALVNPLSQSPCPSRRSVSVQAPTCLMADALTKVVLIRGAAAANILRQFHACALIIERSCVRRIAA